MSYTIGETANRIGLNAPTIRYYDKEGLLPFVDRSAGGIRRFKDADFEWLHLIECLKATNMPIRDIKQFIDWSMEGDSTLTQRRNMFYERRAAVEDQIKTLEETLETIKYKCWFYNKAVEAGSADFPNNMEEKDIPTDILALKKRMSQWKDMGRG